MHLQLFIGLWKWSVAAFTLWHATTRMTSDRGLLQLSSMMDQTLDEGMKQDFSGAAPVCSIVEPTDCEEQRRLLWYCPNNPSSLL